MSIEVTCDHPDSPRPVRCRDLCVKCYRRWLYVNNRAKRIESSKRWERKNPEKRRRAQWRRRYGLHPDEHAAMLQKQGGYCAVCRREPATDVDHNHVTGAVRSLLCNNCNRGIGCFREDPAALRSAAEYLGAAA